MHSDDSSTFTAKADGFTSYFTHKRQILKIKTIKRRLKRRLAYVLQESHSEPTSAPPEARGAGRERGAQPARPQPDPHRPRQASPPPALASGRGRGRGKVPRDRYLLGAACSMPPPSPGRRLGSAGPAPAQLLATFPARAAGPLSAARALPRPRTSPASQATTATAAYPGAAPSRLSLDTSGAVSSAGWPAETSLGMTPPTRRGADGGAPAGGREGGKRWRRPCERRRR